MGHVRNYSIGDALARYQWMNGYNVLHPMGWDSFGLPAENAAIKNNTAPRTWTLNNIAEMRKQMQRMGLSYDWAREVTTCLPEYYRWNQWFFLEMLKRDLAFRRKSKVNWCPNCNTVLANEQVISGCCWRHEDTLVEQRDLTQWFFRITNYADELLDGLDTMEGWPDKVRTMQRNWIGRSEGAEVTFAVDGCTDNMTITVFTTRIDTIFGASSLQLAPDHPIMPALGPQWTRSLAKPSTPCWRSRRPHATPDMLGELPKHGIATGRSVINPFNGEKLPVWVANYVLSGYGTARGHERPCARRARLRVRHQVQPAHPACRRSQPRHERPALALHRQGRSRPHRQRRLDRRSRARSAGEDDEARRDQRLRQEDHDLPPQRLGCKPPALLGHTHPSRLLR